VLCACAGALPASKAKLLPNTTRTKAAIVQKTRSLNVFASSFT